MTTTRRARRHDLAEMVRLHNQASDSLVALDPRLAPVCDGSEKFARALRMMLGCRSHPVFVAQENGDERLLGCAIGRVVDNRPFLVPEYGYIGCFCVDEGGRGQDIGEELFGRMRHWFRVEGVEAIQVDVSHYDLEGARVWGERGFGHFLGHLYRTTESEVAGAAGCEVVIRRAEIRDVEAVLSLWDEMMNYHSPLDERLRTFPARRKYVTRLIERWLCDDSSRLLLADTGDAVVGFTVGGIVDTCLGLSAAEYGHVAHMGVTANWRKRGIGRQLFAGLRDWIQEKGLSSIHIHVSHFSPVSQQFWRSLGFEDYIERLWCNS